MRLECPKWMDFSPSPARNIHSARTIEGIRSGTEPGSAGSAITSAGSSPPTTDKPTGQGYSIVTRDDLGTAYYFRPSTQRVSIVDVKVPRISRSATSWAPARRYPTVLQQ